MSVMGETELLAGLSGGDRRSVGRAAEAVLLVRRQPALLAQLFDGMRSDDPVLAMRCADVAEKVTAQHADWLTPYRSLLLGPLMDIEQVEVRWHVAPMLSRLTLDGPETDRVMGWLEAATQDRSSIVRTMAMQAMADLAIAHTRLAAKVRRHIEELTVTGSPAMRARGRRLLARMR